MKISSIIKSSLEKSASVNSEVSLDRDFIFQLDRASSLLIETFRNNGKILLAGNGGSAADCQHIAAEYMGRLNFDREPLPAISLTANTSIIPDAVGGADIGTTSAEFGDVYIADDKKINFGNDQDASIEYDEDGDDQLKIGGAVTAFTNAVVGKTDTDTSNSGSVTLDFDANQNFVLTLTGAVTLANPTTEKVGQSGFIVFIQDGTGSRAVTLGTDYETAGGSGLTLTATASATDVVPYVIAAANRILLGTPILAFS